MKYGKTNDSAQVHWTTYFVPLLLAWLFATVWGSIVQTQWNLQAVAALGPDIPMATRAHTTWQDLIGFAPVYGGLLAAGWLPALFVATRLSRRYPRWRTVLLAVAAGSGMVAAIRAVDAIAPMPVFIDATRHLPGLLTMAAGAALAGLVYALWTARTETKTTVSA